MTAELRNPTISLRWAGRDVTEDLAPYIEEFIFSDSLLVGASTRDEITIVLNNSDLRFINNWYPDVGDSIEPAITWTNDKSEIWRLGSFAIDKIKPRFSPTTVKVAALSQTLDGPSRDALEKKQSRGWENTTLFAVVQDCASECQLTAMTSGDDVQLLRVDMSNESIQLFLSRLAKTYNRHFAIKSDALLFVIPPNFGTIDIDLTARNTVRTAEFDVSPRRAYAKATISYYDSQQKRLVEHIERTIQPGDRTLVLYDQPSSLDEAIKVAKAALEKENKKAGGTGSLVLMGQRVDAGTTVRLLNAGRLPTLWLVDRVTTTIKPGAGWTSRLQLQIKST